VNGALRSPTVRKFMVGYELLAGPRRDINAEAADARSRGVL
jgi:UDPglucose--hexose-1-phosphate uridylyltransferase